MNMFTRLPISVDDQNLPVISESDIVSFSEIEVSAYEHWIFDQGEGGLVGRVSGIELSPQTSGVPLGYSGNYLTLSSAVGKGLLTGITDTVLAQSGGFTFFIVVNVQGRPGGNPRFLLGVRDSATGVGIAAGSYSSPNYTYAGWDGPVRVSLGAQPADSWCFLSLSVETVSGGMWRMRMSDSIGEENSGPGYSPKNLEIVVGNGYYPSTPSDLAIRYAEVGLFARAFTLEELQTLYLRSKSRMAARGIVIA